MFSFQQLLDMKSEDKYNSIFENLPVPQLLRSVGKSTNRGRPVALNFTAMIYSLLIAKMERMEFVKDIIRRLRTSEEFRLQCRFTGSDRLPSEASYSRLIKSLEQRGVLEKIQDLLVQEAVHEGFITGTHLAVDSSPLEAWDCQFGDAAAKRRAHRKKSKQTKQPREQLQLPVHDNVPAPTKPKKPVFGRGRTTVIEAERRRQIMEAYEATLAPFEKSVANMLPYTYDELLEAMPRVPTRCTKKNSKGHLTSWYGYKANILVDTDSQYVLSGVLSSAHLNDQRMAVVLLKGLQQKLPSLPVKHILGDKGYDSLPIYQTARALGAFPIIDFIHHTEPPEGSDAYFRPVCKEGKSYRYESFDKKYETLRYVSPKECNNCPFANTGCQKVYKIQLDKDVRKYTYPARGSKSFTSLYKKRSAVERVFAYLKEYFGLHRTRHRDTRARVDFELSILAYTLSKLALDKLNKQLSGTSQTA